jgi:hypothetical protein
VTLSVWNFITTDEDRAALNQRNAARQAAKSSMTMAIRFKNLWRMMSGDDSRLSDTLEEVTNAFEPLTKILVFRLHPNLINNSISLFVFQDDSMLILRIIDPDPEDPDSVLQTSVVTTEDNISNRGVYLDSMDMFFSFLRNARDANLAAEPDLSALEFMFSMRDNMDELIKPENTAQLNLLTTAVIEYEPEDFPTYMEEEPHVGTETGNS